MTKEIDRLKKILDDHEQQRIYACIQDIVCNGIVSARFNSEESFPSRQDVTCFVLSWFKEIGVSADRCRSWIIRYSTTVLFRISSSSPSRIRHSTKYLIKFIYRSDDEPLNCGCEQNLLKAACDPDCPIYDEMRSRRHKDRVNGANRYVRPMVQATSEPSLPVKARYKEQFDKAMTVVKDQLSRVSSLDELNRYLNNQGFKTRTGKAWTPSILRNEVKMHQLSFTSKDVKITGAYKSVKEQYRKQYHDAASLIAKLSYEGLQTNDILAALEAGQYKTITGKKWTEANIGNKISEIKKNNS